LKPKLITVSVARLSRVAEEVDDARGELMDVHLTRVDDDVGALADHPEAIALAQDAIEDRALALQRMRPPHRLEPSHEHIVSGVEEQHAQLASRPQRIGDPAAPERDRGRGHRRLRRAWEALPGHLGEFEEMPEHLRRQIVDDVPPQVLEGVGCRGAPRSRHARDDEHLAGALLVGHVLSLGVRKPVRMTTA
jgi:hypothetical protein